MKRTEQQWYDKERENLSFVPRNIPGWVFPIVWMILKTLNTATIVLYSHFLISTDHWAWSAVFALFFVNQALSKFWTILFFRLRRVRLALVLAIVLFATALAAWICIIVGRDNSNLYGLPIAFFVPYTLWLLFAIFLNASWVMIPHREGGGEKEPLVKSQLNPLLGVSLVNGGKFNHKIQ